jgi:hypothetical protein
LWSGLARTLNELEHLAADPAQLEDDDALETLRGLQYRLHIAGEHAYGLAPPAGVEPVHAELAEALAGARDATAELVDVLDALGAEAAQSCVYEWRGALFRVRLARLRLTPPGVRPPEPEPEPARSIKGPLLAFGLALIGAIAFSGGATSGFWPLWAAGMLAVSGSFLLFKP